MTLQVNQLMTAPRTSRALSAAQRQLSPAVRAKVHQTLSLFGDRDGFLAKMAPARQLAAGRDPERAHFGDAPSLAIMRQAYGDTFPGSWLIVQLTDLMAYTNNRSLPGADTLEYLAEAIMQDYYYLKASELLLFFYRFKLGRYGKFYGSVDPMVIMQGLDKFAAERQSAIIAKEEAEQKAERDSWGENAMHPVEWCRAHGFPPTDDIHRCIEMMMLYNFVADLLWKIHYLYLALTKN